MAALGAAFLAFPALLASSERPARAQDAAPEPAAPEAPPAPPPVSGITQLAAPPAAGSATGAPPAVTAIGAGGAVGASTALPARPSSSPAREPREEERADALQTLLMGHGGRLLGNEAYRGTFFEVGATFEPVFAGDGAGLVSGLYYREVHGPIMSSLLAVAFAAAASASRRTHVYERDTYYYGVRYEVYRRMTPEEQAAEDARIARLHDTAADVASDRWFSLDMRLYHEWLGSAMRGFSMSFGIPIWLDTWSGGIVIQPGIHTGILSRGPGDAAAQTYVNEGSWFAGEVWLRIPIFRWIGLVAGGAYDFARSSIRFLEGGLEASVFNRFALRTIAAAHEHRSRNWASLRFEIGVRF